MNHSYIFQEGVWTANGVYMGADEKVVPCTGEVNITHGGEVWLLECRLTIAPQSDEKETQRMKNIIEPWAEGRKATAWTAVNPELGEIRGRYVLVEDSIVSSYETKDGEYSGMEFISKTGDDTYTSRAALLHRGSRISFFALELKRK